MSANYINTSIIYRWSKCSVFFPLMQLLLKERLRYRFFFRRHVGCKHFANNMRW